MITINRMSARVISANILKMNKRSLYGFSSDTTIKELNEIVKGERYLQQRNIPAAEEMLERALKILPFYISGNQSYNDNFDSFLAKLSQVYAWKGQTNKIADLARQNLNQSSEKQILLGSQMSRVNAVLSIAGKIDHQLSDNQKVIQKAYNSAKQVVGAKENKIQQLLTASKTEGTQHKEDIEVWNQMKLEETWILILMNLLNKSSLPCNPNYNKLCSSLLKLVEKNSKKNILKPLIFMISNLLRSEQYLQAQGMLSFCIDHKRQFLHRDLLICNQQYTILNLLLAKTYRGVRRQEEAERLEMKFRPLFDPEMLLVQGMLIDSV